MKQRTANLYGVEASAPSASEARELASKALTRLVANTKRPPVLVAFGGVASLVFWHADSWCSSLVVNKSEYLAMRCHTSYGHDFTAALEATINHVAQLALDHDVPNDENFSDAAAWCMRADHVYDAKRIAGDLVRYFQFQRNYRKLREQGLSDSEAHSLA